MILRNAVLARCLSVLAVGTCISASSLALGATSKDADRLFEKGIRAMEEGKFAVACPALAKSLQLDPMLGTLFTLAECERFAGKSASSFTHYHDFLQRLEALSAADRGKHKDREKVALKQRDAMSALAPRVVLRLSATPPAELRIAIDGNNVEPSILGTSIRLDPGQHWVTVETLGGEKRQKVMLVEREEKVVELALPASNVAAPASTEPPPEQPAAEKSAIPAIAYATGGLAIAGLGVGAVGGILALTNKSALDSGCNAQKKCTPEGKEAADSVSTYGTVSTVGFIVGGVGIAATVVLLLTASKPSPPKAAIASVVPLISVGGPRDTWIGLGGRFE
jgi:hypothetical protein